MSISKSLETFMHLDEEKYWSSICKLNADKLFDRHAVVSCNALNSSIGTYMSVVEVPFTLGLSLLSTPISARRMYVNSQKKVLIEKRLRFIAALEVNGSRYSPKMWDYADPFGIVAITMGFGFGVDVFVEQVVEGAKMVMEPVMEYVGEAFVTKTVEAGGEAIVIETIEEVDDPNLLKGAVDVGKKVVSDQLQGFNVFRQDLATEVSCVTYNNRNELTLK